MVVFNTIDSDHKIASLLEDLAIEDVDQAAH
jgi:hypothetical protein